eukprot:766161-Hanusia_phi.AAC.4
MAMLLLGVGAPPGLLLAKRWGLGCSVWRVAERGVRLRKEQAERVVQAEDAVGVLLVEGRVAAPGAHGRGKGVKAHWRDARKGSGWALI